MNNVVDFTEKMLGLQGLKVIHTYVNNGIFTVCAMPTAVSGACPKCGSTTETIHDVRVQDYMHLPIWGTKTVLVLPIFRLECKCDPDHPFDLRYSFIRKYQRQTVHYEKHIYNLCKQNVIKNVCSLEGISYGKCQRIFNHYAQEEIYSRPSNKVRLIGIDDLARKKDHNYNTAVYDLETHSLIAMFKGRTKEDVIAFFKSLGEEFRGGIEAVAMDMSRSYCNGVLETLPNAKPVIDRFHLSQLFHNQVDDARKHIQNKVRKEEDNKQKVFGIRWSLLKNFEDLEAEEMRQLFKVCDEYPKLGQCFALKEEFHKFFDIDTKENAAAFIEYFKELVEESGIPELQSFNRTLERWREYILNFYDYKISNGPTEGFNNKIKNIKRRAYGYRNDKNFEIRVKLECA